VTELTLGLRYVGRSKEARKNYKCFKFEKKLEKKEEKQLYSE
jgi:hypothetical protein